MGATRSSRRARWPILVVGLVLAAAAVVLAVLALGRHGGGPSRPPGALPSVTTMFPASFWRRPVPGDAALDRSSSAIVSHLVRDVKADQAARRGPWIDTHKCAPPIYRVPAGQPETRVTLKDAGASWAASLQSAFDRVPLPRDPQPSRCSDASLLVWQPSSDRYFEFWHLRREGGSWRADWGGATRHASRNPGYFGPGDWPGAQSSWGASATSTLVAGGLVKLDELRAGHIDHALAISIPQTRSGQWTWPAQRTDNATGDTAADSIPSGSHFRLDPKLDVSKLQLPPLTRMLARAAQRYGVYVTERTNYMVGLGVESPAPYGGRGNPYDRYLGGRSPNAILDAFPWDKLQLLKLRLSGRSG
jgi:hypothetical protein